MSTHEEFEGPSLEVALEKAARRSGRRSDELQYEILREDRGFMGVGTKSISIRVELPTGATMAPAAPRPAPATPGRRSGSQVGAASSPETSVKARPVESTDREGDRVGVDEDEEVAGEENTGPDPTAPEVARLVEDLIVSSQLELASQMTEAPDRIVVNLSGADREELVGRRGEVLDAMQYLVNRMARKELGTVKRIQLESDGYRSDREDELREMALDAAERVRRSGEPVLLPPLNPYERRIIHVTLSRRSGVTTESEGDGFVKRVLVKPMGSRGNPRPARGGSGRDRGGRRRSHGDA